MDFTFTYKWTIHNFSEFCNQTKCNLYASESVSVIETESAKSTTDFNTVHREPVSQFSNLSIGARDGSFPGLQSLSAKPIIFKLTPRYGVESKPFIVSPNFGPILKDGGHVNAFLELSPFGSDDSCLEFVSIYLNLQSFCEQKFAVNYSLSLVGAKKIEFTSKDNSVVLSSKSVLLGEKQFVSWNQLQNPENGLLPGNKLTIFCKVSVSQYENGPAKGGTLLISSKEGHFDARQDITRILTHKWQIDHFLSLLNRPSRALDSINAEISSRRFSTSPKDKLQCSISLKAPNEAEQHLSARFNVHYFGSVHNPESDQSIHYRISLIDANQSLVFTVGGRAELTGPIDADQNFWQLIDRASLMNSFEAILQQDKLTVFCEVRVIQNFVQSIKPSVSNITLSTMKPYQSSGQYPKPPGNPRPNAYQPRQQQQRPQQRVGFMGRRSQSQTDLLHPSSHLSSNNVHVQQGPSTFAYVQPSKHPVDRSNLTLSNNKVGFANPKVTHSTYSNNNKNVIKATTKSNKSTVLFEWTIDDFATVHAHHTELLDSSIFFPKDLPEIKFYLQLHPQGINENSSNHLSVLLFLESSDRREVSLQWKLWIRGPKGRVNWKRMLGKLVKGDSLSRYTYVARHYLLNPSSGLLPDDKLTLCCEVDVFDNPISTSTSDYEKTNV